MGRACALPSPGTGTAVGTTVFAGHRSANRLLARVGSSVPCPPVHTSGAHSTHDVGRTGTLVGPGSRVTHTSRSTVCRAQGSGSPCCLLLGDVGVNGSLDSCRNHRVGHQLVHGASHPLGRSRILGKGGNPSCAAASFQRVPSEALSPDHVAGVCVVWIDGAVVPAWVTPSCRVVQDVLSLLSDIIESKRRRSSTGSCALCPLGSQPRCPHAPLFEQTAVF
mmetsp:Transcript_23301/g.32935  ORF Transcript_23301/g.32935 Transcript_23301/m.32935 type:complete len:221 (+) Transcript_23301:340-1002(+)